MLHLFQFYRRQIFKLTLKYSHHQSFFSEACLKADLKERCLPSILILNKFTSCTHSLDNTSSTAASKRKRGITDAAWFKMRQMFPKKDRCEEVAFSVAALPRQDFYSAKEVTQRNGYGEMLWPRYCFKYAVFSG